MPMLNLCHDTANFPYSYRVGMFRPGLVDVIGWSGCLGGCFHKALGFKMGDDRSTKPLTIHDALTFLFVEGLSCYRLRSCGRTRT